MSFGTAVSKVIGRPRLVILVVAMLFLAGLASFGSMSRQEDPQFPNRNGLITVLYPGATAEVMERLVLEPLQDQISQVEEVQEYSATVRTGVALISVGLLDSLYDTAPAWQRVRVAMDQAQLEFPPEVREMELDDRLTGLPAVVLAVTGDPSVVNLSLAAEQIKRRLMDLPQLSRIELEGDTGEQINIALRDGELQRMGISPASIAGLIGERNRVAPGGFLVINEKRVNLLSNNEFVDIESLRMTQVPIEGGSSMPLSAIADVWRSAIEPPEPSAWQDGEQVVAINIFAKADQVDAVAFGDNVRQRVKSLREEFEPLNIQELFFQPDEVQERLSSLQGSLLISMVIITTILFYVMGWQMGMLVAFMLPLVTLVSLGVYDFGGGVLHQIAIMGLVISLGILIDNAIVMVENIQYRLNIGESSYTAAKNAVVELAGPLGASTATTLAAFTPLLLSKGGTADFTRGIPVMIMLTLCISYLLAVTLAPLLAGLVLKPSVSKRTQWIEGLGNWLANVTASYPKVLAFSGLLIPFTSLLLLPLVNFQFFPNADRPLVVVEMFLPEGTDIRQTNALAHTLESEIRQRPAVASIHRFVGATGPGFYYNLPNATQAPNRARLVVNTKTLADTSPLIDWLRTRVANNYPEVEIVAGTLAQGPPRIAPVEVRVYHANDTIRLAAAEQIFQIIKSIPGAVDVRNDIDTGMPVLRVNVDDASAQRYGISRADIAQTLFSRSFGSRIEQYRQELDPLPIVLRSVEGTSMDIEGVLSSYVYNANNEPIPFSLIASTEADWQVASINHRNGVRVLSITAGLDRGYSFSQIVSSLNQRLAENPLPSGTRMEFGGDLESSGEANKAIFSVAPIGILLLLFFLVLQFNSFRRVGIVLLTVPLAAVGILPGLVLTGSPFGFQPLLGVIALVGIVVNNAIVLIDLVDQQLAAGVRIKEAVSEAVARRTRPILLTTCTTIGGLIPLAFSSSTLWPPMAWAIISGLLASTLLTLWVVPSLCRLWLSDNNHPQAGKMGIEIPGMERSERAETG
jgi:multidrug efflux pump subunit AcrB